MVRVLEALDMAQRLRAEDAGDRRRVAGAREVVLQHAHVVAAVALVERTVAEVLGGKRRRGRERRGEHGQDDDETRAPDNRCEPGRHGANPFSFGRLRG